ncbi:hypothetical protein SK128_019406, partial [Halocaridina rubra]
MSQDGAAMEGAEAVICEDKATSTDDELLVSPTQEEGQFSSLGQNGYYRYIAQAAQVWGADLVGLERPPDRPHSAKGGRYLRHQESLSSNSDVSRPRKPVKLRRHRTTDSYDNENARRPKARELRRQWTTDSSDSGYSKRYSREFLRRQDTEESAGSSKKLIRDLQRQPTNESVSSLRLTRQSSIHSGSDNQSLCLLRQSTVETYDDISTTDFSRPQSCTGGTLMDFAPVAFLPNAAHRQTPSTTDHTVLPEYSRSVSASYGFKNPNNPYHYSYSLAIPSSAGPPLLSPHSCSLINLSTVEMDAGAIHEMHMNLKALCPEVKKQVIPKDAAPDDGDPALRKARERVRRRKADDELPRKVRWSIMATGIVLLFMSVILVGATLKMAPLIDEM